MDADAQSFTGLTISVNAPRNQSLLEENAQLRRNLLIHKDCARLLPVNM